MTDEDSFDWLYFPRELPEKMLQHPKTKEVRPESEWIEMYDSLITAGKWQDWGGVAFWDANLYEVIRDYNEKGRLYWRPLKTKWEFCKGHVIETFDSYDDALSWAVDNGYLPLGITGPCEHPTEEIEYFADVNDLPDGMTDMDIEGNEQTILDSYGLGYEPCLYPREIK